MNIALDIDVILFIFLIGSCAGFLAGLLGIGGGIVINPLLIFFASYIGLSGEHYVHIIYGTSLFAMIFTTSSSAFRHSKQNNVNWKYVIYLAIGSILSATISSLFISGIDGRLLKLFLALLMIGTALNFYFKNNVSGQQTKVKHYEIKLFIIGCLSGLVSALTGLGGGIIYIILLMYIIKQSLKNSIGTSSATIIFTTISASIGYMISGKDYGFSFSNLGFISIPLTLCIISGSLIFAQFGAIVSNKISREKLSFIFAIILSIMSIKLIIESFTELL